MSKTSNTFPCYQINVESSMPVFSQRGFSWQLGWAYCLFSFCYFYVSSYILEILQSRHSIFLSIRANSQDYLVLMFSITMDVSLLIQTTESGLLDIALEGAL